MFQYAFGISVAPARKETLFFTREIPDSDIRRCYALGVFDLPIQFTPDPQGAVHWENPYSFNPWVYTIKDGAVFDGQWQTEKYFNDHNVRYWFSPRPGGPSLSEESQKAAELIRAAGSDSAFLHVRRTDYLEGNNSEWHRHLTMNYYAAAMKLIRQKAPNAKFFVFSDDPEWCQVAFPPEFTVIAHNKPGGRLFGSETPGKEHEDLWLMALCRHGIIANSSFSWWGAWLGDTQKDRVVVGPATWFGPQYHYLDTKDIIPERWIKI
jgi:hypothetical protein